uniref:Uncharacterized protein n=1 Tax=Rhizophora mucronata TaxID=61149 RepID=A0A2P2JEJ4_RHIMU
MFSSPSILFEEDLLISPAFIAFILQSKSNPRLFFLPF